MIKKAPHLNVENIPGTRLGPAIIQKCVKAYRGTIAVESEMEQGTKFTVILPILEEVTLKTQEVEFGLVILTTSRTLEGTQGNI